MALSDHRIRLAASSRYPGGRIQLYIEWRDMWWGLYKAEHAIYLLVVPMLVLRIATRPEPPRGAWMLGLPEAADIDPGAFREALAAAGWLRTGSGPGYDRWRWPGDEFGNGCSLKIPDRHRMADFADLMGDALAALTQAATAGQEAETVLALLAGAHLKDQPLPEGHQ